MSQAARIREPEKSPCNNKHHAQIYEIISRQRYSSEQLLKYLKAKRAAFADGDFALADRLESGIARLGETIALSMDELQRLLAGQSLEAFCANFPEHMSLPLTSVAAEISRLEWLCLKELSGINALLQNSIGVGGPFALSGQQKRSSSRANG
ncbi:hypothetical protein LJC15_02510 [Desulfovibrio sp. OttesenSCG-928-G11]|nr:hypothetical protein [Desulfovibrio sp. OttesenSCG-928-G11]